MARSPLRPRGARALRRRVSLVAACLAALLLMADIALAPGADAGGDWTVASPDGKLVAAVADRAGSYEITVLRGGRPVLVASLGRAGRAASAPAHGTVRDAF